MPGQNREKSLVLVYGVIVYVGAKIVDGMHVGDSVVIVVNIVAIGSVPVDAIVNGDLVKIIKYKDSDKDGEL